MQRKTNVFRVGWLFLTKTKRTFKNNRSSLWLSRYYEEEFKCCIVLQ